MTEDKIRCMNRLLGIHLEREVLGDIVKEKMITTKDTDMVIKFMMI